MLSFNQLIWWVWGLLLLPYQALSRAKRSVLRALGGAYGAFLLTCALAWCIGIGYGVAATLT